MDTPSSVIDVMTSEGEATGPQIGRRETFFILLEPTVYYHGREDWWWGGLPSRYYPEKPPTRCRGPKLPASYTLSHS